MRTRQAEIFALSLSILLVVACARLPESLGGAPGPAWERAPALPVEGPIVQGDVLYRAELANGLRLLLLQDDRLPRVSLGLELARGAGSVMPSEAGLASIASEVMQRGAGERDVLELAQVVEDAGASLSVSAGWTRPGSLFRGSRKIRTSCSRSWRTSRCGPDSMRRSSAKRSRNIRRDCWRRQMILRR